MSVYVRMKRVKFNKLMRGQQGINVNSKDEGDMTLDLYELTYDDEAKAKKVNNVLKKGKNVRVLLSHLVRAEKLESAGIKGRGVNVGKQIQNGLKKAGIKNLVRTAAKGALDAGLVGASMYLTGDPTAGQILGQAGVSEKIVSKVGLGVRSDLRKVGRVIGKTAKQINRNKELKEVTRAVRPIIKDVAKTIITQQANDLAFQGADYLDKQTGDSYYGDQLLNATERGLNSKGMSLNNMQGMGLKKNIGKLANQIIGGSLVADKPALRGSIRDVTKFSAPGGDIAVAKSNWSDAKSRMDYVRSHKKSGSGLRPLGSGLMPLGYGKR